jgi:C4-dicarboxylate transporter, DctM subunit
MILVLAVIALLALCGAPLYTIIAACALLGFWQAGVDLSVVPIEVNRLADTPVLVAIPLFTFAGYLLGESQAPQRLVRLTRALLGWLRGGIALVGLASSALFTAFTGASGVTIVALGPLLYTALREARYSEKFTLGLVATSGCLGLLFAPALPLILYAVVAQQLGLDEPVRVQDLFLAGALPGLLMLVVLGIYGVWQDREHAAARVPFAWREVLAALRDASWELPLPLVVLGGIYSGYFAASEAAAVTALYALVVLVGIRREIPLRRLPAVMRESMVMVGTILIILGVALSSTNYMVDAGVPFKLFELIRKWIDGPVTFLIVLTFFLLLLGMVLDIFSAIVLVVPIIVPVALSYGIDPVHLGILFLATMQIGYIMPPMGMDLCIASHRFKRPVLELARCTMPFVLLLFVSVLIITHWPALSLVLLDRGQ